MPSYANPFQRPDLRDALGGFGGDIIEEDPSAGFGLFQTGYKQAPFNLRRWLSNQYGRLFGEYRGMSAIDPSLRWFDYLANQDVGSDFGALPAYERGERPGVFAPRSRFTGY